VIAHRLSLLVLMLALVAPARVAAQPQQEGVAPQQLRAPSTSSATSIFPRA